MEINLIEEDAKIEEIEGYKTLKYTVKDNGKNINKVPVYTQWLKSMKVEKGENGKVTYCTKCHSFFYYLNHEDIFALEFHKGCFITDLSYFCEYCGELYSENSICCFKKLVEIITQTFSVLNFCLIFIPFLAIFKILVSTFTIIYSKRINKKEDINYINHIYDSEYNIPLRVILILMYFLNTLVFFFPYLVIYFFSLYFNLKIKFRLKNDNEIEINVLDIVL